MEQNSGVYVRRYWFFFIIIFLVLVFLKKHVLIEEGNPSKKIEIVQEELDGDTDDNVNLGNLLKTSVRLWRMWEY